MIFLLCTGIIHAQTDSLTLSAEKTRWQTKNRKDFKYCTSCSDDYIRSDIIRR